MKAVHVLIAEKVNEPFGIFFSTGEGAFFPDGTEESSGFVVTRSGRHFFYWTGWDHAANAPTLDEWQDEQYQEDWSNSPEYLVAVAKANR